MQSSVGEGRKHATVARGGAPQPLLGYACVIAPGPGATGEELHEQAAVITRECRRRGVPLGSIVRERATQTGKVLERPGLGYALARIVAGEAGGLVVSDLAKLSRSAADLGTVLHWFIETGARLILVAEALDTAAPQGRIAVGALIAVADRERERVAARTRKGLQAARANAVARGRPAVADDRALHARIVAMRGQGMTLQAIADVLNEEGVPTVRGGLRWRPSSVQRAAGYRRRRSPLWPVESLRADEDEADPR
jgi:DNA invertase Pin-like site-specific DNA recombinase